MDTAPPLAIPDDALLLRRYLREGSEAAFRALAERCLPLVWSVARRVVNGNAAMAEDVAQVVLADFARMAHRLAPDTVPAAWLHRHTVFTATKAVRSEVRRLAREQTSLSLKSNTDPMSEHSALWEDVAPLIDSALDRLPAADRNAIILRYYEQRPLREIGRAIGITEEAARKRIDRALTKLRSHFNRRGTVPAAAILAAMIRDKSVAAPPAAAAQRMLTGAWKHVEAGAFSGTVTAQMPWWRRRGVIVSAAALMLAGMLWMLFKEDSPPPVRGSLTGAKSTTPVLPAGKAAASSSQVILEATIMTLPENSVSGRMLTYEPGRDDTVLYRELRPFAEALEKKVEPEGDATAGHPLVVLSGPAKLKRMADKPLALKPDPENPFATPPWNRDANPGITSITKRRAKNIPYATEWPYDPETGFVTPGDYTDRSAGTELSARVYQPDAASGLYLTDCTVKHMLKPEWQEWRHRQPDESEVRGSKRAPASIQQPRFQTVSLQSALALRLSGEPVLAASCLVRPGNDASKALRVFLFLNLKP